MSSWTNVPKPVESSIISFGGDAVPWGLLLTITSVTGGQTTSVVSGWTDIAKSQDSVWTIVPKPT